MAGEIFYGIGALILLAALVWGVMHYRQKSARANAITEEATREEYEEPARYDAERQEELEERAEAAEAARERRENS